MQAGPGQVPTHSSLRVQGGIIRNAGKVILSPFPIKGTSREHICLPDHHKEGPPGQDRMQPTGLGTEIRCVLDAQKCFKRL